MSSHELVDVVDEGGAVLHTTARHLAEVGPHLMPNVLIFLFDPAGRLWIQRRPQSKKDFPGCWDITACGGIVSGETPEEAAYRELLEEAAVREPLTFIEEFVNDFQDNGILYRRYSHVYCGTTTAQLQPTAEVDEFACQDLAGLRRDVEAHPERYVSSFIAELDHGVAGAVKHKLIQPL